MHLELGYLVSTDAKLVIENCEVSLEALSYMIKPTRRKMSGNLLAWTRFYAEVFELRSQSVGG